MIYQLDNAVHARFATKFAISLQVVSLHVKAFSQQFGKPTKKKTDLVVCYLHCASSNSSRRDNRLRTGVNGESFASCRYETEFSSLLALWRRLAWELATATYIHTYIHTYFICHVGQWKKRQLKSWCVEETAARKESRCMSRVHVLDKTWK